MSSCTLTVVDDVSWTATALDPNNHRATFAFYDAAWLAAWDKAFLSSTHWRRPVSVYSVNENGSPLGFLALARQSVRGIRVKSLAGYYYPCRTLAVSESEEAQSRFAVALAEYFASHPPGFVLRFGPVSSADRALERIFRALAATGWHIRRRQLGDLYELVLPDSAVELEAQMSKSLLKNIQYLRRRLAKSVGPVSFERTVVTKNCTALLDTVSRIEAASWIARKGNPKFIGDMNRVFWTALSQTPNWRGEAVIWVMRCGDAAIAFSAHIETADTTYIIANSYDETWKLYSPGSIISFEVLNDACRRGKRRVDWGQGDSGYKSRWGSTSGATQLYDVILLRPGLPGSLLTWLAKWWPTHWHSAYDG